MKLLSSIAAAVIGTSFVSTTPAEARPFVYLDSFTYGKDYKTCIKNAEQALVANGFANFEEDENARARKSDISGFHKRESLTAVIECNQRLGITTFSVSGLDNDITYEMYEVLFEADW